MPSMFIGGAERSLLGLLDALDKDRFKVSLFLFRHEGEFMPLIPDTVNLLPSIPAYDALDRPIRDLLRKGRWIYGAMRIFAKLALTLRCRMAHQNASAFNTMFYIGKYLLPFLPRIQGEYDLAINFIGSSDILINRISANVKMGWVHTDYSKYNDFKALDDKMWRRWGAIDHIVNVSEDCTHVFRECFPFLSEKCITIENILSTNLIRRNALELDVSQDMPAESGVSRLCSVGRFCYAKNFDAIPAMVQLLNKQGCRVKWYLIGGGPDETLVREKIKENHVEGQVILLWEKINPYPYMKACDIYVQPSRYEGKAVTVREAQILGKPVLITDFPTAKSQLEDGVDGMICPLSIDGVVDGIRKLVDNKELREKLATTAAARDYSNREEVEKIYHMID